MPVSYTLLDKKKGAEKIKLSLSARRNIDKKGCCANDGDNVGTHSDASKCSAKYDNKIDTENLLSENICPASNKFAKKILNYRNILGQKRPLNDIHTNTLEGVKRIKLNTTDNSIDSVLVEGEVRQHRADMLNGYHNDSQNSFGGRKAVDGRPPIATLSNLGNTCFLNSVLYTLRFTPNFLHNLHHLAGDLALADQKLGQVKAKSSSLGRNFANLANSGSRSWSSKDLLSLGGLNEQSGCKSKIQVTTEKMHEMFASLRAAEARDNCEPYQADTFLAALRNVNSIFEGNQQQDAHELLMCLLDSIRETCRSLQLRFSNHVDIPNGSSNPSEQSSLDGDGGTSVCTKPSSLGILRKSWKNRKKPKTSKADSPTKDKDREGRGKSPPPPEEENGIGTAVEERGKTPGFDFVAEDFEGTTILRTTCLECETVTERKQTMCDISVPIPDDRRAEGERERVVEASDVYRRACVTSECLRDQNKYWCDECARYNEARRSVTYETLPRLLVLQLKRFSGGMEKLTAPMPTPLALACFCDDCGTPSPGGRPHTYTLYGVIMHLGQTLTGGHYIAYIRARFADSAAPYLCCERDDRPGAPPTNGDRPNFMKNLFARGKGNGPAEKAPPAKRRVPPVPRPDGASLCSGADCCGVRLGRSLRPSEDGGSPSEGDVWLMCDDDTVKPVSAEDFDELLSAKPKMRSASTPYLLFYVRSEPE